MNPFLKRLVTDIPLMGEETLGYILNLALTKDDVQLAEHPAVKRMRADMAPKVELRGDIAIVPVQGTLAYNPDPLEMLFDGVEDSRSVLSMIQWAADNPDVKGILIRMDTPGGMLLGGPEMADAVTSARRTKPVVTHIGGLGASLGYMIASQSTEIVGNRSSISGSVGVIASVVDYSGLLARIGISFEYFTNKEATFKGVGAVGNKLTDAQRENIQQSVDSAFTMFKDMVRSRRPNVKDDAMRGQTFRGSEAKAAGLIDRIGDEQYAISVLKSYIE